MRVHLNEAPGACLVGTNLVYNPVVTYYDYQAAKAAMVGLTRNLAAELGPKVTQPVFMRELHPQWQLSRPR